MTRLIFPYIIVLMFACFNAWSNPECVYFYKNKTNPGGQVAIIGKMIGSRFEEMERAITEFSELNLSQIKVKLAESPGWERALIDSQNSRLASIMETTAKLSKANFFLSPFHHALFLNATGLAFPDSERGQANYFAGTGALTRKKLKLTKDIIEGTIADSQKSRAEIASLMAQRLERLAISFGLPVGSGTTGPQYWHSLDPKSKERQVKATLEFHDFKIRYAKVKAKDTIPSLDALFEIIVKPDGVEHLTKLFEYLLPENLKIAEAQARGVTSSITKYGIPTVLGTLVPISIFSTGHGVSMSDWVQHYVANKDLMLVPLVTIGGFLGSGVLSLAKTTYDLPDLPGRVKSAIIRRRLKNQTNDLVLDRAQKDIHLERDQVKALRQSTEMVEKLDIDFNGIKSDLHLNTLFSLIELSEWQTSFINSISKMAERTLLLEEKNHRLKHLVEESFLTAQKTDLNATDRATNLTRIRDLNNDLLDQVAQLTQFQMDLLFISAAYDRYVEKTNQALDRNDQSIQFRSVIETKRKALESAKANISAMAAFSLASMQSTLSHMQTRHDAESLQTSTSILNSLGGPL